MGAATAILRTHNNRPSEWQIPRRVALSSPQFTLREALRFDPGYQTIFEGKLFYDGTH